MKLSVIVASFILLLANLAHADIIKSLACVNNACAIETNGEIKYRVSTENSNKSKLIILDLLNIEGKSQKVPETITVSGKKIYLIKTALHKRGHYFRIVFIANPNTKYSVSQSNNYLSIVFSNKNTQNMQESQSSVQAPNTQTSLPSDSMIQPLAKYTNNTQVIEYAPNQVINIGLLQKRTVEVDFPSHIAKLITGISTNKISAEVVDNKLFLKPLEDNILGDLYISCANGIIYHLFLQSTTNAPLTTIIKDIAEKRKTIVQQDNNSIANFLIEVRNHSDNLDVSVVKNPQTKNITKDITLTITKVYQGTQYTAYEGIIKNISPVRIRVPYENIYFKDLLGIAVDDMYLNPQQTSKIWLIVSHNERLE